MRAEVNRIRSDHILDPVNENTESYIMVVYNFKKWLLIRWVPNKFE